MMEIKVGLIFKGKILTNTEYEVRFIEEDMAVVRHLGEGTGCHVGKYLYDLFPIRRIKEILTEG